MRSVNDKWSDVIISLLSDPSDEVQFLACTWICACSAAQKEAQDAMRDGDEEEEAQAIDPITLSFFSHSISSLVRLCDANNAFGKRASILLADRYPRRTSYK